MIWFTLGLFVVSFLLTALLTPKPEFENARPDSLDPENFPRATENAPVPLVLGCVPMRGPNTLYYGGYRAVPITEKVKTGLFSSTRVVVGHTYYLTVDLGLCLGPNVGMKQMYIDDVAVTGGTANFQSDETGEVFAEDDTWLIGGGSVISTDYDVLSETGLTEAQINNSDLNFIGGFTGTIGGAGGGAHVSNFSVIFYDSGGGTLVSPDGPAAQSAGSSADGVIDCNINCAIPPGTTDMRINATINPLFPFSQTVTITDIGWEISGVVIQTTYTNVSGDIFEPELYGGVKSGGGHIGDFNFYPGNFDQIVDPAVEALVGTGLVPAYSGTCHIVLVDNNIGESLALRKMHFDLFSYEDNLSNGAFGRAFVGSEDIDLAEALYIIMTNTWRGLSIPASDIDIASFQAASAVLFTEENGGSISVTSPQNGKKVITEILRQIDGIMYQDHASGKIKLKLIRDDYVAGDLTIYDEDEIKAVRNFTKTAWADVRSQVKVSYASRDGDSSKIAIAQNAARAESLGLTTAEISFPFCYDADLANRLAARELAVISVPLFSMSVEFNRSVYNLEPGEVIKISWPKYGLTEVIMRVQKIDIGELLDNKIVVDLVQDVFSSSAVVVATPSGSLFQNAVPTPLTIATQSVLEMPYFFSSNVENPVADGNVEIIPLPVKPQTGSTGFAMISGDTTGDLDITEPNNVQYPTTALFDGAYSRLAGFETGLDAAGFDIDNVSGTLTAATTTEIRTGDAGIVYANGEWFAYEGVTDNGGGSYTLTNVRRALLGTHPVTHADNSRLYVVTADMLGTGLKGDEFVEGSDVYYKILDIVGGSQRSPVNETEQTYSPVSLANRPLRPRNLELDGSRSEVPLNAATNSSVDLTWVSSNREVAQIAFEDDATQTPDQTEQYDLEVWVDGVQDMSLSQANISQSHTLDLSSAVGLEGEIRLYAKRTGGDARSSLYYALYPFTLSVTADNTSITADTTAITADKT